VLTWGRRRSGGGDQAVNATAATKRESSLRLQGSHEAAHVRWFIPSPWGGSGSPAGL